MFWKAILWLMVAGVITLPLGAPFAWLRPIYRPFIQLEGTQVLAICFIIGLFWPVYLKPLWKTLTEPVI